MHGEEEKINRVRAWVLVIVFALLLGALFLALLLNGEKTVSEAERRPLAQRPTWSLEALEDGSYFTAFEEYALDQFVFRDGLRGLKAISALGFLGKRDNNALYYYKGALYKIEETNEARLTIAAEKLSLLAQDYAARGMAVYYSVIPDKNTLIASESGRPCVDVSAVETLLGKTLTAGSFLKISDLLSAEDYYKTDLHWNQKYLPKVADALLSAMNSDYKAEQVCYTETVLEGFRGVYSGQSALPLKTEELTYLTEDALEYVTLRDLATNEVLPLYEEEALASIDPYNFFAGGTRALLSLENAAVPNGKTLYLFRDSFASALSPLLVSAYSEIVLIDLRYVNAAYLDQLITFREGSDVLFLYSTTVLNTASGLI